MTESIQIGQKEYLVDITAITPIRFRLKYGFSFISKFRDPSANSFLLLCMLIYTGITEKKPDFKKFVQMAAADDDRFIRAAIYIYCKIYEAPEELTQQQRPSGSVKDFDEMEIVAGMADCGIPSYILREMKIFQIVDVYLRIYRRRSAARGGAKMASSNEVKQNYKITPEIEAQIEAVMNHGRQ